MRFHEQSLTSPNILSEDLQTYLKGILPVLVEDGLLSVNPHAPVDHSTGASRFLASLAFSVGVVNQLSPTPKQP